LEAEERETASETRQARVQASGSSALLIARLFRFQLAAFAGFFYRAGRFLIFLSSDYCFLLLLS